MPGPCPPQRTAFVPSLRRLSTPGEPTAVGRPDPVDGLTALSLSIILAATQWELPRLILKMHLPSRRGINLARDCQ
jgi:hypothetical protein